MIDWLKEQWQWIVGGLLAILAIFATKKRDSKAKIKEGDLRLEKERSEKIVKKQTQIYDAHAKKRDEAEKDYREKIKEVSESESERIKELENNPEKLDKILKDKYGLKGE